MSILIKSMKMPKLGFIDVRIEPIGTAYERHDWDEPKIEVVEFQTDDVRENVRGVWLLNHMSQLWVCSNCHKEEIRTTKFCPHCGADMRGEKNG